VELIRRMVGVSPVGLFEELALERYAVDEREREVRELWAARQYASTRRQMALADAARVCVERLEGEVAEHLEVER
jgi:hypothetical protein